jgi:uncharacterized protein (TIGR02246 family)
MTANHLKCLEPLVGRWHTRAHTHDGVLGPGVPVTSTEEFYWLDGGHFLVQTYETVFGNEPAQKGINYWFYDAQAGQFRIIFFSNNGPFTEEGNCYEGHIAGTALTFVGPARFQYELDANGNIKKNGDGTISIDWWLRDGNGRFQPWMTNVFRQLNASQNGQPPASSGSAHGIGAPGREVLEIRRLLERWAAAVQSGDQEAVLRDHSDDIVMFDVPPPERGVRGIHAYRDTWPPFFNWLRQGGMFEIDALEVTAGDEVAFAHALLRCSTVETLQKQPDKRLRLTVGLRKTDGRWAVAHEHHSFTQQ